MQWEIKQGKVYTVDRVVTDSLTIHESLAHDLIAKKLHNASYIKSIKDRCNYDGTRTITVTYDNGCRRVYKIKF